MNTILYIFLRSKWPQKYLLMIWVNLKRLCGLNMWKEYKQGFARKWDILIKALQVHLLLSKEHFCYRQIRNGERKHKSIHRCIEDANLSILNLSFIKKNDRRRIFLNLQILLCLGCHIQNLQLYGIYKDYNIYQYDVRKSLNKENKKPKPKVANIQCFIISGIL